MIVVGARSRSRTRSPELSIRVGLLFGLIGAGLYTLPVSIGGFTVPMPWLAFVPVFFWAAARPRLSASA
ncbi:MAG: hypothetical protein MI723_17100, partial [Caulobacterales bacterium]|nr:hypothetical protein [Caulobacterales bacterium]